MRISDWSSDVCSSDLLQPLERAHDEDAVRPGTGEAGIDMIAARLGLETAVQPVAILRFLAHESAAARFRVIPGVAPDAVNQQAHISVSPSSARPIRFA